MPKKKVTLSDLDKKLSRILSAQKKMLKMEEQEIKLQRRVEKEEREELEELRELEKYEREIKEAVGPHPLKKITYRDVAKGTIGALIGVVAHYTFVYGIKVAHDIDLVRATLLYPISYGLGGIFMYMTGFRRVKDPKLMSFLPLRLTVLYVVALTTAFLTLLLFNPEFLDNYTEAFKQLATVTLTAVIGACTADLIGKE